MKNEKLKFVCISNNSETFDKVIGQNPNMNKYKIIKFDNSIENIGISKRYNSFIQENITPESDFWVAFVHQDFGIEEDILPKLETLDKNFIYGAIGTHSSYSFFKFINLAFAKIFGFFLEIKKNPFKIVKKPISEFKIQRIKCHGQIKQGENLEPVGNRITKQQIVTTLDCCCMIAHSSLMAKYNLKFDENLNWHMYVEDFCLSARKLHNIKSKAIQLECYHLGAGNFNEDFYNAAEYVMQKHNVQDIRTTCINT